MEDCGLENEKLDNIFMSDPKTVNPVSVKAKKKLKNYEYARFIEFI
jgi:hypothetical protein